MRKNLITVIMGVFIMLTILGNIASAYSSYGSYSSDSMIWFPFVIIGLYIALFVVWILVAIWVYKDAKKRKADNPVLWLIIVIFGGLIGILIWLAIRPPIGGRQPYSDRRCPNCGRGIPLDARICPYCGRKF